MPFKSYREQSRNINWGTDKTASWFSNARNYSSAIYKRGTCFIKFRKK